MRLIYLGSAILDNAHLERLQYRKVIQKSATQLRERYVFGRIESSTKNKYGTIFLSTAYGESSRFHKTYIYRYKRHRSIYIGYVGRGILRWISSYINAFIKLLTIIKSRDIVITYNMPPIYALPIMIKRKLSPFTLLVEFEDLYNNDNPRWKFYHFFEKWALKNADSFIASSSGMYNYIMKTTQNRTNSIIINGGYYCDVNINYDDISPKHNPTTLLYSGTLDKERGILKLISLFQGLPNHNYHLQITGEGPLQAQVEQICETDSRISYLGFVADETFLDLLYQADVCINPQWSSISVNFPSKITMYLSIGKMVLSTNISSLANSYFKPLIIFYDEDDPLNFIDSLNKAIAKAPRSSRAYQARIDEFRSIMWKQDKEIGDLLTQLIDCAGNI